MRQRNEPSKSAVNSYAPKIMKVLIFLGILATIIYFIFYFYYRVFLNKSFVSFMDAEAQTGESIVDEIFTDQGNISIKWEGLKYTYKVISKTKCEQKRDSIFILFFSRNKDQQNCFSPGSEEQILFDYISKKLTLNTVITNINESKIMPENRKKQVLKILDNKSEVVNRIYIDLNDNNLDRFYSQSFRGDDKMFISLINRINILIYNKNYVGASKLVSDLFEMPVEKISLNLNEYFYQRESSANIFSFYEKLRKDFDREKHQEGGQEIVEFFNLFLNNFSFVAKKKYKRPSDLKSFLIKAVSCSGAASYSLIKFRKCLKNSLKKLVGHDLIVYKLRQLGDDSLENLWIYQSKK